MQKWIEQWNILVLHSWIATVFQYS